MLHSLPCSTTALPIKRKIPPNSNNETQLKFFSTKKRRVVATKTISKPSSTEVIKQRINLQNIEPKICGVCLKEDDSNNDELVD